ncbi:MAG: hypothetical protein MUF00_20730, partial [Gemmatimonadaceae bacterium]|nr:hypothetical protein [Gemmatimonadaceae bacterium]
MRDSSIFGDESLWTTEHLAQLDRYFVRNLDEGDGGFYEKLDKQLAPADPAARKLMAELLWVLYLFPSNLGARSKRDGVLRVWQLSGNALDPEHPMVSDAVLAGIGSGGMAFLSGRWREINYAVGLFTAFKQLSGTERSSLVLDYARFADWIAAQARQGNRQFRHMLRYLLFPDVVERMSSNGDRHKVLEAFGVAAGRETEDWTDRQIDEAMLALRQRLESEHGTKDLDFYLAPLVNTWRPEEEPEPAPPPVPPGVVVREPKLEWKAGGTPPLNQILFGPPGTGKTYHAIDKALEILDPTFLRAHAADRAALKVRFDTLAREGLVQFVTFHQSFSYEDFVEGLRAESDSETGALRYEVVDGVFKRLCEAAQVRVVQEAPVPFDVTGRRIWKLSLGDALTEQHIYRECINSGYALLGYGAGLDFSGCTTRDDIRTVLRQAGQSAESTDFAVTAANAFVLQVKPGDLVVVSEGNLKFRAIGQVTGDYRHLPRPEGDTYAQCRNVRWLRVYSTALPIER